MSGLWGDVGGKKQMCKLLTKESNKNIDDC